MIPRSILPFVLPALSDRPASAHGQLTIRHGSLAGRLAARLGLLPPASPDGQTTETAVRVTAGGRWFRSFGGAFFDTSWRRYDCGRDGETVGPLTFLFEPSVVEQSGRIAVRWRHTGTLLWQRVPLPLGVAGVSCTATLDGPDADSWQLAIDSHLLGWPLISYAGAMRALPAADQRLLPLLHDVLLFDGHCLLCNASADFVIARDARARQGLPRFKLAALQSEPAQRLLDRLAAAGVTLPLPGDGDDESVLVVRAGAAWPPRLDLRSAAALRICRGLVWPWPWLAAVAALLPPPLLDHCYRLVARNRLRWFGVQHACRMPSARDRDAFLDHNSPNSN